MTLSVSFYSRRCDFGYRWMNWHVALSQRLRCLIIDVAFAFLGSGAFNDSKKLLPYSLGLTGCWLWGVCYRDVTINQYQILYKRSHGGGEVGRWASYVESLVASNLLCTRSWNLASTVEGRSQHGTSFEVMHHLDFLCSMASDRPGGRGQWHGVRALLRLLAGCHVVDAWSIVGWDVTIAILFLFIFSSYSDTVCA